MFDPRHAAVDSRMAELARQIRELEVKLPSARTREQARIRVEIARLRSTFLDHQDEPWPEDLERVRQAGNDL